MASKVPVELEHLSVSNCHSSEEKSMQLSSRDVPRRIIAGDYVLKKKNNMKGS